MSEALSLCSTVRNYGTDHAISWLFLLSVDGGKDSNCFLTCSELCFADIAAPDLSMPYVSAPGLTGPDASMPAVEAPDVSMPGMKPLTMPGMSAPDASLPGTSAPDVSAPDLGADIPAFSGALPAVSAPGLPDAPGASMPSLDTPVVDVSGAKLDSSLKPPGAPDVTLPEASMPSMPGAPAVDASLPSVGAPELPTGSVSAPAVPGIDASLPAVSLPEGSLPALDAKLPGELPESSMPGDSAPDASLPSLPGASLPEGSLSAPAVDESAPEVPGAPDMEMPHAESKKKSRFHLPSFLSPSGRKAKKEGGASGKLPGGMITLSDLCTRGL